jgi:hypothetical protein
MPGIVRTINRFRTSSERLMAKICGRLFSRIRSVVKVAVCVYAWLRLINPLHV